jgi:N-acetylneuraminic acid mutarotase
MPTPRAFLGAAVAGGRIYVIGGRNESGEVDVNEVFSPVPVSGENDWSIAAPLPVPRSAMGIVTVADTIHLVGGVVDGSDNVPSLIYLPSTNTWNSLDPSYSQSSSGLGLVPVELNIYVLGGKTQEEVSAQNQSYRALFVIALPFVK